MPNATEVLLRLTLDADGKPYLDIASWTPPEAASERDELLNLAVVIRDAVENGDLDEGFNEVRQILGLRGLPKGVSDAPEDDGRKNSKRGLRVAYVNPDLTVAERERDAKERGEK